MPLLAAISRPTGGYRALASSHVADDTFPQSALATSASLAWAYSGLLGASFTACSALLSRLQPVAPEQWAAFDGQVPQQVFAWQVAGFGGVLVLNAINLMFCSSAVQYNCNVLLGLIHAVAFATDWALAAHATPLVVTASGRMFVPLRYVQWLHTTPTMILLMGMMAATSRGRLAAAVAADVGMVLTGLAASWTTGHLQLLWLTASMACFCHLMSALVAMFRGAAAEVARDTGVARLIRRMLVLTLLIWSLFPAVWMAAWAGVVGMGTEQVLWGCADYLAKVVFSSHLWQKNLATVQQRREAAQELMGALDRGVMLERMAGLTASRERLMHALSHELSAPIHGIMALVSELAHNKTQSAAGRARMLAMIRSSAACLLNTIATTLSLAGDSSGDDDAGNTATALPHAAARRGGAKVSPWRVAEAVVRLTRPLARDGVSLINAVERGSPPVRADSARLMQVLSNLLRASLRLTASGKVTISAATTSSGGASEGARGVMTLVVSDTGDGMPPDQLAAALDPFDAAHQQQHALSASSSAELWQVARAGLGLYLVRTALAGMGSRLQASSEVGAGSRFVFELPLADSDCDSESEAEQDMFSEYGSLRGSLELSDIDRWGGRSSGSMRGSPLQSRRMSLEQQAAAGGAFGAARTAGGAANGSANAAADDGSSPVAASAGASSDAAAAAGATAAAAGAGGGSEGAGPVDTAAAAAAAADPDAALAPEVVAALLRKPVHRVACGGGIQVMSVDDDAVNQLVAATVLRSHKWEVVKAMSGSEALDYLFSRAPHLPDLLLLDVMMPSMSGYEVAAAIRRVWPSSVLPIIMVSAKTEEEDVVRGLRCGADDYLTKPFKRAELAARIRAHIRARDALTAQQASEHQWMLQHNLLPLNVQRKLRNGETVIAESHPAATVLWAEVVAVVGGGQQQQQAGGGGQPLLVAPPAAAAALSPAEAVVRLNSLYASWEELCAQQNVLGVDFSGSSFVAVSGHDDSPAHTALILAAARRMLGVAAASRQPDGSALLVRLGVHTGALTTGLVGGKAVKLVLMGDTVEAARQLAASGRPGAAHVSGRVLAALPPGLRDGALPWSQHRLPGQPAPAATYMLAPCDDSGDGSNGQQQQQQQEESSRDSNAVGQSADQQQEGGSEWSVVPVSPLLRADSTSNVAFLSTIAAGGAGDGGDGADAPGAGASTPRVAVAAAVSCAASRSDGKLPLLQLPDQQQPDTAAAANGVTGGGVGGGAPAAAALSPGSDGGLSAALVAELGAERRQLAAQLLERSQEAAAAAAELACVRQQLRDAQAAGQQATQECEAMRQQVAQLVMRAHLTDCWQALATMRQQLGSLALASGAGSGSGVSGGGGGVQQQQRQLLQSQQEQVAALLGTGGGVLQQAPPPQLLSAAGGGGAGSAVAASSALYAPTTLLASLAAAMPQQAPAAVPAAAAATTSPGGGGGGGGSRA